MVSSQYVYQSAQAGVLLAVSVEGTSTGSVTRVRYQPLLDKTAQRFYRQTIVCFQKRMCSMIGQGGYRFCFDPSPAIAAPLTRWGGHARYTWNPPLALNCRRLDSIVTRCDTAISALPCNIHTHVPLGKPHLRLHALSLWPHARLGLSIQRWPQKHADVKATETVEERGQGRLGVPLRHHAANAPA